MSTNTNLYFVDYTSLGYGNRVGLFFKDNPASIVTNPREEIGKFGVSNHIFSISRLFHKTIAISAKEAKTNESKIIYLNRSSTIKWLNAQLVENEHVNWKNTDAEIVSKLNNLNKSSSVNKKSHTLNNQVPNSFLIKITSLFCKIIISLTRLCTIFAIAKCGVIGQYRSLSSAFFYR